MVRVIDIQLVVGSNPITPIKTKVKEEHMEIIVEWSLLVLAKDAFKELIKKYTNKIAHINRLNLRICFNNGDTLHFVSENGKNDGRRADIACGINAKYYTCNSKDKRPIREYEEILKYIESI